MSLNPKADAKPAQGGETSHPQPYRGAASLVKKKKKKSDLF